MLRVKRMRGIAEVLEEMVVLVDTRIFNEFSEKVLRVPEEGACQPEFHGYGTLREDLEIMKLFPKTLKVIEEIQENLLCVGKRKEMTTKKNVETMRFCSNTGLQLSAKHIISCCKKASGEINAPMTSLSSFSRTTFSPKED